MPQKQKVKTLAVESFFWLTFKRVLTQILLTGTNLILVRLLFPEQFGVFAIISFIVTLSWSFADLGLGRAIVQSKTVPSPKLLRSIWWTQTFLGVSVALVLWFLAPIILRYYQSQIQIEEAVSWLRILALSQVLTNMSSVSQALLERKLSYKKLLVCEIFTLFTTNSLTLLLAYFGLGVVSFVWGNLFGKVISLSLFLYLSPWKWGFSWNLHGLKKSLSFGVPFQMASWVGILNGAVLPVFVGRFPGPGVWSGAQSVGFISWAAGVASLPAAFSGIADQIIFPLVSRVQKDLQLASVIFTRSLRIVLTVTLGGSAILFSLAPEITKIIYTPTWLPALTSLRLAIIQMGFIVISGLTLNTLLALGEVKFYRNMNILWAILQWVLAVPLVLAFGFWGFNLAGIFVSATAFTAFLRLKKYFKFSMSGIIRKPAVISIITCVFLILLGKLYVINTLFGLLISALLGGFLYIVLIYFFMKGEVMQDSKIFLTYLVTRYKRRGIPIEK